MFFYLFKYTALIVSIVLVLKINRNRRLFPSFILALLYSRENSSGYCWSQQRQSCEPHPKESTLSFSVAARGGVIGDAKSRRLFSIDAVSPSAVSRGPTRRYWRSNLGSRASITELRTQRRRCRPGKMAVLIELRLQRETVPRLTLANRRPDSPNWLLARILVIAGVTWGGRPVV